MGWITLDRGIQDNWLWQDETFSRGQAWIDLILLAEYKTHKGMYKGNLVDYKRGDVNISISELANKWGWSRKKTTKFLKTLESDGMVIVKATTYRTTITLVKYDDYQLLGTTKDTTEVTTGVATEGAYLKKDNKYKKNNNNGFGHIIGYPKQNDYDFDELERLALNERRN